MRGIIRILVVSIFVCGIFIITPALPAQTNWWVDDNAPGDPGPGDPSVSDPLEDGSAAHPFDAIQEGIDASSNGDTVLVADGTYTGTGNRDIDFLGKAITVTSENGPDNCIVDCQGSSLDRHRGFYFHSGEGLDSILEGVTIKNGYMGGSGGGILCDNTSPTIKNNVITQNENREWGAGIYCEGGSPMITGNTIYDNFCSGVMDGMGGGGIGCLSSGSPVIKNNVISNNSCYWNGGGIRCVGGYPVIDGNIITDNFSELYGLGGGIYCACQPGFPVISNNIISGNEVIEGGGIGGGIFFHSSSPMIANNLITGNYANYGCGIGCGDSSSPTITSNTITGNMYDGIWCDASSVTITNCILWNNGSVEIYVQSGSAPVVTYTNIEGGYSGTGNINADPLFVTGPLGDYFLSQIAAGQLQDSPCVDAGDPMSDMIVGTTRTDMKPDTGIIDMGYHYPMIGIQIPPSHFLEELPEFEPRIQGTE